MPYDCGFVFVKNAEMLRASFSASGAYLTPGGGWDLTQAYSPTGTALLDIESIGWYSIGAQSREATTLALIDNRFIGQFLSYDPVQANALLDDHAGGCPSRIAHEPGRRLGRSLPQRGRHREHG